MRIENRTRNTLLGYDIKLVPGWWGRLRGFIGHKEPNPGEGILLIPCDSIHTFWMKFDLDIAFLDHHGKVLEVIRSLKPWKWTRRVRGARSVLELAAGMIDRSGTQVGDRLAWWDPTPVPRGNVFGSPGGWRSRSSVGEREE